MRQMSMLQSQSAVQQYVGCWSSPKNVCLIDDNDIDVNHSDNSSKNKNRISGSEGPTRGRMLKRFYRFSNIGETNFRVLDSSGVHSLKLSEWLYYFTAGSGTVLVHSNFH